MNENLDIFICTHTQPYRLPTNPVYKLLSQKKMDFNTSLDVIYCEPEKMGMWGTMPRGLSELFNMYYVRHFVEKKKYIGFCQYRTFPLFFGNVPDMDKFFQNNDILVHRFFIKDVDKTYAQFLDPEAYSIFKDILKTDYPEFGEVMDEYLHQYEFAQRNTFIMKTEDFNKMIDFVFEVMAKYLDRINCHNDDELYARALDMIEKKTYAPTARNFQIHPLTLSRYLAYFAEALISFYVWKNFEKRKTMNIFMTGIGKRDGE